MEKEKSEKKFSLIARLKSTNHAWRGIGIVFKTSHNAQLGLALSLLVFYLGFVFGISTTEWLFLVFAVGLVFVAEALNSAIEIDIDLTSPEYHPYAKDTKDVAAGAVLLSVIIAVIIGAFIFLPKLL
ncbi:MAG: diacylglycerol kinase family protein [Candidatus Pacebacteria bacterium]|nr:diacylglycerol kinase family protein [Candidatus Paceibacterota bacterium]